MSWGAQGAATRPRGQAGLPIIPLSLQGLLGGNIHMDMQTHV